MVFFFNLWLGQVSFLKLLVNFQSYNSHFALTTNGQGLVAGAGLQKSENRFLSGSTRWAAFLYLKKEAEPPFWTQCYIEGRRETKPKGRTSLQAYTIGIKTISLVSRHSRVRQENGPRKSGQKHCTKSLKSATVMTTAMTTVLGQSKMSKEEYLAGNNDLRSICVCRPLNLVTLSSASYSSATMYDLPRF